MTDGLGEDSGDVAGRWDRRLLFDPLNTLSGRTRWAVVLAAVALTVAWCAWANGNLMVAWGLPDVAFYVDMAQGRFALVPQPFSARPLAPLLARWIAGALHCWVQGGFTVLAYVSLAWTAGVVYWLASKTGAPRWTLAALASVPFWPQLLGHAGLPDPLYAGLLACLLVALERDWMMGAAVLMFPLMLARESTSLTLLCLLLVGWKRMRWGGSAVAVGAVVLGSTVVHRLSAGGLPNPEHLSGGLYMVGKVVANLLRSVGLMPWSNVYPELCRVPAWQIGFPLGPVRGVGLCGVSRAGPLQMVAAGLTTFGVLPVMWLAGWRQWRGVWRRGDLLLRFCLVYGGISFAIAPALGTWYARLFGYGWPLLLVGAPRLLADWKLGQGEEPALGARGAAVLGLHLVVCALTMGFLSLARLAWVVGLEGFAFALILVHQQTASKASAAGSSGPPAW